MLQALKDIIGWLFRKWDQIPESERDRIIRFIVESFDAMLRAFFRDAQNKGTT